MSGFATGWALAQPGLDPGAKLILVVLADAANPDNGYTCWQKQRTIVERSGLSRSTVQRKLAELAEAELITIGERRREDGSLTSNLYTLAVPHPEATPSPHSEATPPRNGEATPPHQVKQLYEPEEEPEEEPITEAARAWGSVLSPLRDVASSKRCEWKPAAVILLCTDRFTDRAHTVEAERFREYWIDGRGQNRPLRDVAAAWRNWLRTAPPASSYAAKNGHRSRGPTSAELRAAAAQARELEAGRA